MNLVMVGVVAGNLLGSFTVTAYRSVPNQTDNSPFITSTGEAVCVDGVAVSQDLLKSGVVKYGDWVYIEGTGLRRINDTMHPRNKNHFDVWVKTKDDETKVWKQYRFRSARVWKVQFVETPR